MNHLSSRTVLMRTLLILLVGYTIMIPVYAQDSTARTQGVVVDSSHKPIPNASLKLVEKGKNHIVSTITADDSGLFFFPQVPLGNFELVVNAKGYSQTVVTGLTTAIKQVVTLEVVMKPGADTSTFTVKAARKTWLEKSTSNVSTLLSPSQIADLPMASRDITSLLTNVAGVSYGGDSTNINTSQISASGSPSPGTEVLLDGMSVLNNATGQIAPLPSPDAIQEFRLTSMDAPAEFGRTSGVVMQVVTHAGSNDFHAKLYGLYRNDSMTANGYFNNLAGKKLQAFTYSQYGAALSGPVQVPKLYSGRNRSFFMLNYDHTMFNAPNTSLYTLPTAAFRNGDFSSATNQIQDPQTGKQFPGNMIPSTRFDSAAVSLLSLLMPTNATGSTSNTNLTLNNTVIQANIPSSAGRYSARFDQEVGAKNTFYALAYRYLNPNNEPIAFNQNSISNSYLLDPNYLKDNQGGWVASVGLTRIISPKLIVQIHYGFADNHDDQTLLGVDQNGVGDLEGILGIQSLPTNVSPSININGYSNLGTNGGQPSNIDSLTYIFDPSVTYILGHHILKAGVGVRWNLYNVFAPHAAPNGQFAFTGEITNPNHTASPGAFAMADFLLGDIKTASYEITQPRTGLRSRDVSFYLQDDWRILPRLTLNLGIRYEYEEPIHANNNLYSRIDLVTGNLLAAGLNANRYLNITSPKLDMMPRIGFAYALRDNLVLRGAFGVFYSPVMQDTAGSANFTGFAGGSNFSSQGTGVPQPFKLSQGLPLNGSINVTNPFLVMASATASNPVISEAFNWGLVRHLPHYDERNLGFELKLPYSFVLESNYVGGHGVHLPMVIPGNVPSFAAATTIALQGTALAARLASPWPDIAGLSGINFVSNSNYNSLQTSLRKQFGPRLIATSSYTWSHAIDDGGGVSNSSQPNSIAAGQFPSIPQLRTLDRSSSSFDARHNLNFALQIGSTSKHFLLDGWKLSPVFVLRTGLPLNISQTNEFAGTASQRPDGIGDNKHLKIHSYAVGTAIQYLMPTTDSNFPITPSGPLVVNSTTPCLTTQAGLQISPTQYNCIVVPAALGNIGRNSLRAPGEVNMDASLQRTFHVRGKTSLLFRAEGYNVFNHTNFNAPNTNLQPMVSGATAATATAGFQGGESFGQITGAHTQRYLQLLGKLSF